MAKGFTDWDVPVNINAQTLGEIISRPKYGAIETLLFDDTVLFDAETSLGIVSGKGMIYGGFLSLNAAQPQETIKMQLKIDGVTVSSTFPKTLYARGITQQWSSQPYLLLHDPIGFAHMLGFNYGWTFEESVEITLIRATGVPPTVVLNLHFALI